MQHDYLLTQILQPYKCLANSEIHVEFFLEYLLHSTFALLLNKVLLTNQILEARYS